VGRVGQVGEPIEKLQQGRTRDGPLLPVMAREIGVDEAEQWTHLII